MAATRSAKLSRLESGVSIIVAARPNSCGGRRIDEADLALLFPLMADPGVAFAFGLAAIRTSKTRARHSLRIRPP
jgi:hypothetical protein